MMEYSVFSTFLFWIRIIKKMQNKLKPNYLIMHHLSNSQQSIRSTTLVFDIFVRLDSVSVWVKKKFCNRPRKIEFDLKLYFFYKFCHEIKTNWTFLPIFSPYRLFKLTISGVFKYFSIAAKFRTWIWGSKTKKIRTALLHTWWHCSLWVVKTCADRHFDSLDANSEFYHVGVFELCPLIGLLIKLNRIQFHEFSNNCYGQYKV